MNSLEENITNLDKDNNKRFMVNLEFRCLDTNLYRVNVKVTDRTTGYYIELNSYK
ncbi:hypothetical protein PL321_14800 [Caloramator sp. mosi_1]|uniref:hypothetical protein n=1 Tax=Caloramator sp. mosi_1 TaxID=3023090 RepID=UPI0023624F69|nr:hypothetical protein [Caloramator sp. mosi_1]WDC83776.1 hypothetical protein PL321_14800 [Caloramator sp. mosi_1]